MKNIKRILLISGIAFILGVSVNSSVIAAEMDQSKMKMDKPAAKAASKLEKLAELPPSGKAREAGFDDRYAMEATSSQTDSLATQCAKATRGIVMVDNETWARCGGKPKGWSMGAGDAKKVDHSKHNM